MTGSESTSPASSALRPAVPSVMMRTVTFSIAGFSPQ